MRVGDKVKRVRGRHNQMESGDTDIIMEYQLHGLCLKNYGEGHDPNNFEVIREKSDATRVEVIDENGRSYSKWDVENFRLVFQDNNKTLKIFINE